MMHKNNVANETLEEIPSQSLTNTKDNNTDLFKVADAEQYDPMNDF